MLRYKGFLSILSVGLMLMMLCVPSGYAQLYSGILSSQRATIEWATAGATIKTAGHTCGVTLASSTSISTLNISITACASTSSSSDVGVLNLASGTFNLSGAINMKSNVILRGAGMGTILNITSTSGSAWLGGGQTGSIAFQGSFPNWADGNPPMLGYGTTGHTWVGTNGSSGTYTQGATVLNMGSDVAGLSVGDELICWQQNVASGSVPNSGFFLSSKVSNSPTGISLAGTYYDMGGVMETRSLVTAIGGTGNRNITIADPLIHPNGTWLTGLNPMCGWITAGNLISNAGIENLLVQTINNTSVQDTVIGMWFAYNCWVKGVGIKPYYKAFHLGNAVNFVTTINDSLHITFRDNWTDRAQGGGASTTTTYGTVLQESHFSLIENNIYNNVESPNPVLLGQTGNAYMFNYENYVNDDMQEGGLQMHDPGSALNLLEGNRYSKVWVDAFHGNSVLNTFFRNHIANAGFDIWTYNRWYNLIGNAINSATAYIGCESDSTKYNRGQRVAFRLGYPSSSNSSADSNEGGYAGTISADPLVCSDTMIWGNFTALDSTSHFTSGEVPSADPVFPNSVPASTTLPASFRYSLSPSWWPTGVSWPLIGPDVTGGSYLSAHAKKTPAQLCFEAAGGTDAAWTSTTINSFTPATCYDGGGAGQGGAIVVGGGSSRVHGR